MRLILIILIITPLYLMSNDRHTSIEKQNSFSKKLLNINPENRINYTDFKNYPNHYTKLLLIDNKFYLTANMRSDHRIFGFSKPSHNSNLMILFSIYTNDVENNPFSCLLGSYYSLYYDSPTKLTYLGDADNFIKTKINYLNKDYIVYFEKKWINKLD